MLARPAAGDTFMWKLSQTLDLNMPPASSDPHALLLLPYANGIYRTSPELNCVDKKCKGSPYSTAERRVLELIPVLGNQPAR